MLFEKVSDYKYTEDEYIQNSAIKICESLQRESGKISSNSMECIIHIKQVLEDQVINSVWDSMTATWKRKDNDMKLCSIEKYHKVTPRSSRNLKFRK
jgi:hypothetical protein